VCSAVERQPTAHPQAAARLDSPGRPVNPGTPGPVGSCTCGCHLRLFSPSACAVIQIGGTVLRRRRGQQVYDTTRDHPVPYLPTITCCVPCPLCQVRIRQDRAQLHVRKLHPTEAGTS